MSDNKEIEVVSGDGSNLNFSPVSDHITSLKPKAIENKEIIIPETTNKKQEKDKKNKKK